VTATLVTNSYILPTLAYGTPYWWRVRAGNVCGDGEWAVFSFTTTQSALCSTAGFLIPDGDTVTGASQILDFGISGTIEDLDISLHVLHSWVGDLDITLEHIDSGTSVRLIDQPNGNEFCNGDNIDAVLDDEAGSPVNDACKETVPCIEGAFTPENPLSGFDGESITGSWKLTVHDNVEIDSGAVMLWCLLPTLATTPGESSGASYAPLRVTGRDDVTGDISLSFETACGATSNNIYFGPLSAVGSAGWSGEDCAIGTGPTYDYFNPGTGSYFFVVVGNDGSAEGSYGSLRPPYGADSCGQTQTLMNSCD
jgi:subtilisin-like proprotein convertase family protein